MVAFKQFHIFSIVYFHFVILTILITKSESKKKEELPKFYFTSKLEECPKDTPEIYYEEIAEKSLATMVQESKVFFGVLLDNLEEALVESEDYEKLHKTWEDFTKTMSENFDNRSTRIYGFWNKVFITYETPPLPWEVNLRKAVIYEIFSGLHYEYLFLEAVVMSGVKEIVSTLQNPFGEIIRELGETIKEQEDQEDTTLMLKKAEEMVLEIEPNFTGRLLSKMLKNGRRIKENHEKGLPPLKSDTFLTEPIEHIGILRTAYREKSHEYPNNFWRQMALLLKPRFEYKTGDEMYTSYSQNEEKLLLNLLNLLSSPMPKES